MDFGENTLNSVGFAILRETFIGLLMFNKYPCIHLSINRETSFDVDVF